MSARVSQTTTDILMILMIYLASKVNMLLSGDENYGGLYRSQAHLGVYVCINRLGSLESTLPPLSSYPREYFNNNNIRVGARKRYTA